MKKKLISLLFLLGLVLVISPMVLSCSDKDESAVEPDVPVTPDVPLPPVPTPIRWVENEVDGGERGVGIKVTSKTTNNFVFECTPGDKVQSYRLDVYPLCRMYNYLFESGGVSPLTKNRLRMPVKIISGRIGFTLFRIMMSFILASI